MKLESLKSGKFAAQVLAPEILQLVSGGQKYDTDHFPTGKQDTSKYSRCGINGELYDMQVSLNDTGQLVIQGVGTERFKGTTDDMYQ